MGYPSWAPRVLINHQDDPLAIRLANENDERAKEVWASLRRQPNYSKEKDAQRYYLACVLSLSDAKKVMRASPAEYKRRAKKIAETANKLHELLSWEASTLGDTFSNPSDFENLFSINQPFRFLWSSSSLVEAITGQPYCPHPPLENLPETPFSLISAAREKLKDQRELISNNHEKNG